ncbi:MAG TPA: hypothetical protein VE644_07545 [Gaiellaceae bacterium]|jgi:hypothetical protein|nr:hypothetical protein [Gaiellaceae bacterium]
MRTCASCRGEVEERFRFCPWCSATQRLKIVDFFHAHPAIEGDRGKALRVSRYLGGECSHVRFSVWNESPRSMRAEAAVSLDEEEAERLARFLVDPAVVREETETPLR